MELLVLSFIAGGLTILAPCILPLLPVIVGGSLASRPAQWRKPLVISGSLAISVIIFTLLLKATTALLGVPAAIWELVSGVLIMLLGATLVWPDVWRPLAARFNPSASRLLGNAGKHQGMLGDIMTGAALGPVFTSCSPTYALIVASVLPVSFAAGLMYLGAYAIGLAAILLLVSLLGQRLIAKLQWASNPRSWFKRAIGILFIVVGLLIATGLQKQLETYLVQNGWYDPFSRFEQSLMR